MSGNNLTREFINILDTNGFDKAIRVGNNLILQVFILI